MMDLLQKIEQSRSPKNIEAAKKASGYTSLAAAKRKKDVERKVVKADAVTLQHQESVSDMLNIKRLRRRDSVHSSLYSEHRGKSNMSSYKNLETRKDSQKAQFILSPVAGRKNVTSIQSNYADTQTLKVDEEMSNFLEKQVTKQKNLKERYQSSLSKYSSQNDHKEAVKMFQPNLDK